VKSDRSDPQEISRLFRLQAEWTAPLRKYLYRRCELRKRRRVLDAGCGTGEITAEIAAATDGCVTGLDANEPFLAYAKENKPELEFTLGDCRRMPFRDSSFDLILTHLTLMWIDNPELALAEMVRVIEPGGAIVACAEPDYGGLIDYPENARFWGAFERSLARRGADVRAGRKLGSLFRGAGLGVRLGVSSTVLEGDRLANVFDSMRDRYLDDLEGVMDHREAMEVLETELALVEKDKILVIPLFWAIGYAHGAQAALP
jgi:SAM-dependent methyltransferase